jgi:UDP-2,3-diacylglucosamine pyrophosphatase LpxH
MEKRALDIALISDVHLGSYDCHALELLNYLETIKPGVLILNGDFIDTGKFDRKSFPKEHMQIINAIFGMALKGTKVYYITGNRDDVLRKFSDFSTGTISLRDKLVLLLKNKKYWIFHGDVFDSSLKISPRVAKLGGKGYDLLLRINRIINRLRKRFGKSRMSFSRKIKNSVKRAVEVIRNFENTAIKLAAQQEYDFVICGHIHQPVIKEVTVDTKQVTYMNSGDWVENLTALEYNLGCWSLYKYDELDYQFVNPRLHVKDNKIKKKSNRAWKKKRMEMLFKKIVDSNQLKQQQ